MKALKTLATLATDSRFEDVIKKLVWLATHREAPLIDPEEILLEVLQMKKRLDHLHQHIPEDFEVTQSEQEKCTKCNGHGDYCYEGDGYHYGSYKTCPTCRGKGHIIKLVCVISNSELPK
jgi:hypothetical protein